MKKVLFIALALVVATGCKKEDDNTIPPSTFPQLNGKYWYHSYEQWGYVYERSVSICYTFDETRKALVYHCAWSYTESGWKNPSKKPSMFEYEWKVENGKFFERLWDNEFSSWKGYDFEFIDDKTIIIDDRTYKKRE